MQIIFWIAIIVLAIGGYSWYRDYQDRALTARLKAIHDKDSVIGEIDAATAQLKAEGEFRQRNRGKF
ncbi:MAG: hypothetical protein JWN14_1944 [Chthonomonadales bacterium]|nr:hypothetical protein [Chthonomonadales bacterium]